jgi:hypothetical protein
VKISDESIPADIGPVEAGNEVEQEYDGALPNAKIRMCSLINIKMEVI